MGTEKRKGGYGTDEASKWLGGVIYWRDAGSIGPNDPENPSPAPRKRSGPTYIIRKRIAGHLYSKSTRCTTLRAALKELERFEQNPAGYEPGGGSDASLRPKLLLDEELATAYLTWCRDEQGNSAAWLGKQRRYLADWADAL
jgi:hypothetical protein